jgi:methylated-DNA-protein-cysteine methyltransferase related protein
MARSSSYQRIYAIIRRIPKGKVATYGQIAMMAGMAGHARQVGYALHVLPEKSDVPWHRVINARGLISLRSSDMWGSIQKEILLEEGVSFDADDRVSLVECGWRPKRYVSLNRKIPYCSKKPDSRVHILTISRAMTKINL